MLSAEKLLSATDLQRVLGLSREGLRKMRARGEAPKSVRVGSVNVTPLGSFLDWVSQELARACRPKWTYQRGEQRGFEVRPSPGVGVFRHAVLKREEADKSALRDALAEMP